MKCTYSLDELEDVLDELEPVAYRPWRHGYIASYVFPKDGRHWRVHIPVHHEDGWQGGQFECQSVVPKEVTVIQWADEKD